MSGIYMLSQEVFEFIGKRYGVPEPQLLSISLALVTSMGIHIINDANRFDGEHREVLYKSSIAQTVVAVTSTVAIALLCKTITERSIGLLVSCALTSSVGVYYKRSLKDAIVVSLFLSVPPVLFHTHYSSVKIN